MSLYCEHCGREPEIVRDPTGTLARWVGAVDRPYGSISDRVARMNKFDDDRLRAPFPCQCGSDYYRRRW